MKVDSIHKTVLTLLFAFSVAGAAQNPNGAAIFQQNCAVCHQDGSATRAPSPDTLHKLSRDLIVGTLESGVMKVEGSKLTREDRLAVAEFLSSAVANVPKPRAGFCEAKQAPALNDPGWTSWGADPSNSRFQSDTVSGLNLSNVPRLQLKWAFGFQGAAATYGQPTVFGGRVYAGSEDGTVYSLDAKTGCIYWTFKAPATVKTAVVADDSGRAVFFGDVGGNVYALDSASGSVLWKARADPHPAARITGSPVYFAGRLFVPVSSGEEGAAVDSKYPCCTFRGSVVALDAQTGQQIWKAYTIPRNAHPLGRRNSAGTELWGPSGGAVWSSPTIDPKLHAVYVASGNSYSDPPNPYTDAVIAFNLNSGKMLWSHQLTANDRWNIACVAPDQGNCPPNPGHDFDFGAPPLLRALPGGRDILIAAQKSGIIYGLDPAHQGRIIWTSRIGKGGPLGGVEWGGSADQERVYLPLADWDPIDQSAGGGLFALQIATGKRAWYAPPVRPACLNQNGCSAAQSSPTTVIPGVVFAGSEDGHLRAHDSQTGRVIWDFDTLKEFKTINAVEAHGGSMNATGPAIAGGMLYVDAGYTNNISGNVLLAFSVDGK